MQTTTVLDKMREWLATYPGQDLLSQFTVDWTNQIPNTGGIFPNGIVEGPRKTDIFGNITVQNQYNFGLYYTFTKAPADTETAEVNAEWIMDFQEWVQEQSCTGLAPTFGDEPWDEKITAQNGTLFEANDEGTAMYMVQLTASFKKNYYVKGE